MHTCLAMLCMHVRSCHACMVLLAAQLMTPSSQVFEVYNFCENGYFSKEEFYPGVAVKGLAQMVGGATGQAMPDGTVELYTFMQLVHHRGTRGGIGKVENVLVLLSTSNGTMAKASHFEAYADVAIADEKSKSYDERFVTHKNFYENPFAYGQKKQAFRIYSGVTSVSSTSFFRNGKLQTHVFMVSPACAFSPWLSSYLLMQAWATDALGQGGYYSGGGHAGFRQHHSHSAGYIMYADVTGLTCKQGQNCRLGFKLLSETMMGTIAMTPFWKNGQLHLYLAQFRRVQLCWKWDRRASNCNKAHTFRVQNIARIKLKPGACALYAKALTLLHQ